MELKTTTHATTREKHGAGLEREIGQRGKLFRPKMAQKDDGNNLRALDYVILEFNYNKPAINIHNARELIPIKKPQRFPKIALADCPSSSQKGNSEEKVTAKKLKPKTTELCKSANRADSKRKLAVQIQRKQGQHRTKCSEETSPTEAPPTMTGK